MSKATYALLALLPFASFAYADSYKLEVDGLACQHCADNLEKHLRTLGGVQAVQFDLEAKQVDVDIADGQAVEQEQLRQAVKESGYTLVSIEQTPAITQ